MTYARLLLSLSVFGAVAAAACGGGAAPRPTSTGDKPEVPASAAAMPPREPAKDASAAEPETPAAVYARVEPDLVSCYEVGKKAVPTMLEGRATISVAVDAGGRATCVVVGDDRGLTQAVEDCMSARLSRETFAATGAPWSTELSVVARGGKLALGEAASAAPSLDTLETHGLPDSAHDVIVSLIPRFRACTADSSTGESSLRVVHVGARVAKDGRVACALASSPTPIPPKMRDCVVGVLASATFPPPTTSVGLVSVPLKVQGRK